MLVLHYTGMETGQAALDRMRDEAAEVSAHYMVWEDGRVVQLVGEDKRAWHAGVSSWQGDGDLNSRAIGVEIVNGGHDWPLANGALPPYPQAQIDAVIALCQGILSRWTIPVPRIVGHADIAPTRKADPGEHFPWATLAANGIGYVPSEDASDRLQMMGRGLGRSDKGAPIVRLQDALVAIGYGLEVTGKFDEPTRATVTAFQRRWVQDRVSGEADLLTLRRIEQVRAAYAL